MDGPLIQHQQCCCRRSKMLHTNALRSIYLAVFCRSISTSPISADHSVSTLVARAPPFIERAITPSSAGNANPNTNASSSLSSNRNLYLDLLAWPPTPFHVSIPAITSPDTDYKLRVVSAYPVLPSQLAKVAILSTCYDMINWIDNFPPVLEAHVLGSHTVIEDFDDSGIVTLDLVPVAGPRKLSRRLALRGVEAFRALVARFGEADLRFDLLENNRIRGRARVNVRS